MPLLSETWINFFSVSFIIIWLVTYFNSLARFIFEPFERNINPKWYFNLSHSMSYFYYWNVSSRVYRRMTMAQEHLDLDLVVLFIQSKFLLWHNLNFITHVRSFSCFSIFLPSQFFFTPPNISFCPRVDPEHHFGSENWKRFWIFYLFFFFFVAWMKFKDLANKKIFIKFFT